MAVYDEEKQIDAAGSDEKLNASEKQAFDDIAQADTDKDFDDIIRSNFDPEEVAAMEKRGSSDDDGSDAERGESRSIAASTDFFKDDDGKRQKAQGFFSRNRGRATMGIGLAVLLGGGGFGLFAILAGPLQFVQIAKMLQGFHFSNQEDISDDRMTKISRYLRYNGDQRTRMGVLGNRYADSLEARLNRAGIESSYGLASYGDGYVINAGNIPNESELAVLNGKDFPEQQRLLSERFNVPEGNISLSAEGKLFVSSEGLGYFENKRLIRTALEEAGYSKIGSAIRSRIMGKRAGLDWHPIKRIDKKLLTTLDARLKSWQEERESRIKNGVEDNPKLTTGDDVDSDGDGVPDETSPERAGTADAANNPTAADPDVTVSPDVPDPEVELVKGKLAKAGAASAVVGLLCLAKGISENIDSLKEANVVKPLMRLGGEGLAVGNQIITGQNIDSETLGFLSKKLFDDSAPMIGRSWKSARSIQAELGEDLTGPDIGSEAAISNERNAVAEVLNEIPGLGTVCEVANSVIGQIVSTALDFLGGPLGASVGLVISNTLGPVALDAFARWIAGNPININVAGANYGNYINYGARLAANDSIIASGGVKLTAAQSYEWKQYRLQNDREEYQQKSMFARLFDPTDIKTPLGNFMSEQAPDPAQNIARVASMVPRTIASVFSVPSFITGKAKAATNQNYDYGFDEYGYSLSDLRDDRFKNPQENAELAYDILQGPDGQTYKDRAAKCFGITFVDVGGALAPRSENDVPPYYEMDETCTDPSESWTRVRFFILDSQLTEGYACYQDGADNTCNEFELDGSARVVGGQSGGSTTSVNAPGLNGYAIPCTGLPTPLTRLPGPRADWSAIKESGVIGTNSGGSPIRVYIREACDTTNVKTVVVAGSIHGSENGGQLVAWQMLFNEPLPSNVRVIAIPEINATGVAGSLRRNANGVDLNRNFDFRWGQASSDASCSESVTSCMFYHGTSAGSEPETQALVTFLLALGKVDLFTVYHDNLNYVAPVGTTPLGIGNTYAQAAGMSGQNTSAIGQTSTVTQHGSLDGWYNSKTGSDTILVELGSNQSDDVINKQVQAIKTVLAL